MQKILISPESGFAEIKYLEKLTENGADLFHIRKPGFDASQMESYLKKIPSGLLRNIVIHDHYHLAVKYGTCGIHFPEKIRRTRNLKTAALNSILDSSQNMLLSSSVHNIATLHGNLSGFDYVFFSPVFSSISKNSHHPRFSFELIRDAVASSDSKVIALGGIAAHNVTHLKGTAFAGFAVKGAVWNNQNPIQAWRNIMKVWYGDRSWVTLE